MTIIKKNNLLVLLPTLIAPVILFLPLLLTGKAIYWGTPYLQFVPWRDLILQILKEGTFPLWNSYNGMGAPLLANYQVALFYPTTWFLIGLEAIGGISWMAWGQTLVVIFHLIWAGIGMIFLVRKIKLGLLAQAISGLTFAMCSYLVARASFLSINAAVAWIPWIILFGTNVTELCALPWERKRWKLAISILLLSGSIALQFLAGHAQTCYYTMLLLFVWMIYGGIRADKLRGLGKAVLLFCLAVVIGLLFSAAQLLPTAEYLIQSQRSTAVDYNVAMNYSFFPIRLITLIFTDLFGNPAHGGYLLQADNYWEDAIYIGLLPILLAIKWIVSCISRKKEQETENGAIYSASKSLTFLLVGICIVTFIWAMGKNTPVFPFLYHYIPTIAMFQAPTRISILMVFSLVLLAGMGIDSWKRPEGRAREWTRRGVALCIAILLGAGLGMLLLKGELIIFIRSFALTGLIGLGVALLSLFKPKNENRTKSLWAFLVILLVGADLMQSDWGLNPGIDSSVYKNAANVKTVSSSNGRIYIDAKAQDSLMFDDFFYFNDFNKPINLTTLENSLIPDSNILADISSANNYDPMVPGRYSTWMTMLEQAEQTTRNQMLALMDVGLVESVAENSSTGVVYSPSANAFPLRWTTCAVAAESDQDALSKTLKSLTDEDLSSESINSIVVEGVNAETVGKCDGQGSAGKNVIESEASGQLTIDVNNNSSGWLLIPNTWYPGWKAYLDGHEISIYRGDYLFMALQIPGGQHSLVLKYQPLSFMLGVIISITSILAGSLLLFIALRRKRCKLIEG